MVSGATQNAVHTMCERGLNSSPILFFKSLYSGGSGTRSSAPNTATGCECRPAEGGASFFFQATEEPGQAMTKPASSSLERHVRRRKSL
jgi:hypothetical protein